MPKASEVELEQREQQRVSARERLLAKKPRTAEVTVVLDDELVLEHDRAVADLEDARKAKDSDAVARLTARVDQLAAEVAEATVVIKLRSMGGAAYDALVDAHPPTEQQKREAKENGTQAPFNSDTFCPALIAASVVEPELTEDDVAVIWREWNTGERMALYLAALDVNSRAQRVGDLGKGFGGTRG